MHSPQNGSRNTEKREFLSKLDKVPESTSHTRDPISLLPRWAPSADRPYRSLHIIPTALSPLG